MCFINQCEIVWQTKELITIGKENCGPYVRLLLCCRLYNKDAIIEYLLDKSAERPNAEAVTHIRGIKVCSQHDVLVDLQRCFLLLNYKVKDKAVPCICQLELARVFAFICVWQVDTCAFMLGFIWNFEHLYSSTPSVGHKGTELD